MNRTISHIDNDKITLELPSSVSLNTLDSLVEEIKTVYRKNKKSFNHIVLDLSGIKYIEPEGALSLICFCSSIKNKNENVSFHFIYPPENVLRYLITIGFFGQMSNKVGVIDRQDIVNYENKLRQERRMKQKKHSNHSKLKSIILPIETIPQKNDTISGGDFENMSITFVNHAITTLNELFTLLHFNLNVVDQRQFILSNRELYRNIFEHSKSWGIALIHARPYYGTTVCYYDIGIGFKGSVAKFNSDLESIEWALIDGNSSKSRHTNDGFGLTIVQDLVLRKNGYIKIRSGEWFLQINSNSRKSHKVNRFPGVQMSYFIPNLN